MRSPISQPAPFSRIEVWLLTAVLVWSFLFRLWFGLTDYQYRHYWDEQFSFENSLSLLRGELKPANGYYQLLSYAPQTAALFVLEQLSRVRQLEGLTPYTEGFMASAYVTVRSFQAIYGTGVLLLAYLIARRIFDRRVAMLTVIACGFSLFYVWACAWFKPDALLAMLVMLAMYWTLLALDSPNLGRYLRAGAGVGLAMSAKLTGGLVAIPLVVATAVSGAGIRRGMTWVASAGAAALGVFLLLNPYWKVNLHYLDVLTNEYQTNAADSSRWQGLGQMLLEFLPGLQGVPFAVLFWLGFVALTVHLIVRRRPRPEPAAAAMLLSYPVVFTAAYFYKTAYFKGNNFLSTVPIIIMLGSWALVGLWDLAERAWVPLRARPVAGAMAFAVVSSLTVMQHLRAYRQLTPTTEDAARIFIWNHMKAAEKVPRIVVMEPVSAKPPAWSRSSRFGDSMAALWTVDRVEDLDPDRLARVDGEILYAERLSAAASEALSERTAGFGPDQVRRFGPGLFELRGPEVVAVIRPWTQRGPRQPIEVSEEPDRVTGAIAELPAELESGEMISLAVWIPFKALRGETEHPQLAVGERVFELHWAARVSKGFMFLTERFEAMDGDRAIRVLGGSGPLNPSDMGIECSRWDTSSEP